MQKISSLCYNIWYKGDFKMKEIYSNADDCLELARYLKKKMGNKIEFYGSVQQEVIQGKYFSHYREPHSDLDYLFEKGLSFCFKFCEGGFLRIGVGSLPPNQNSVGEKLAALSSFYEVLSEQYGEPTVFYTTKGDEEGTLSLHWSFINKEEEIQEFRNGSCFDDAEIEELIVIDEPRTQNTSDQLSDTTRQFIARKIGIPFELISLVDKNIEEFLKFKTGTESIVPKEPRNDGPSHKMQRLSGVNFEQK